MRSFLGVIGFGCVVLGSTTAWAQFGMYGSPELLQLPQVQSATPPGQTPGTAYAPGGPQYGATYRQTPAVPPMGEQGAVAAPLSPMPNGAGQGQSVVNQILNDPSLGCAAPPCNTCQQAGGAPAAEGCGCGCGCYTNPWYGAMYALALGRDNANKVWTSFQDGHNENQLMNTEDAKVNWRWGGEIRFGRRFCCDQWALEATYWTTDPWVGSASVTSPTHVSTPLHTSDVVFGNQSAENWFDGADEHRLSRRDEVHNVEINLIRNHIACDCNSPWNVDWSVGARFFRFEEELTFASLRQGGQWNYGGDCAFVDDSITNNLFGLQAGLNADYCLTRGLKVFATPKFGIYNNHIDHEFNMHLGDGTGAAPSPTSGVLGNYPATSYINRISFLTQVDVGLDWQFAERWSVRAGYRVMVATGIGLADAQIPPYLVDLPAAKDIDANGQLVLHGAFAGLTYNF
jgi:hypothetical protein